MATQFVRAIEFGGGPADGHVESIHLPPDPFVAVRYDVEISRRTLFSRLRSLFRRQQVPSAVYELSQHDSRPTISIFGQLSLLTLVSVVD